jgi:hypothetical protein
MKPSEKIEKLYLLNTHEYRPGHIDAIEDTVNAIIDFLDERYEKGCWCGNAFGKCPADKHVFEDECDCYFKGESLDGKGTPKGKIICGCQCHISQDGHVSEEGTTFCTHKGYNTVAPCDSSCPVKNEPVSERNALIDEIIDDIRSNVVPGYGPYLWILEILKSKKK